MTFIFILLYKKNIILQKQIVIPFEKCYEPPGKPNIKIIHLIITRFIIDFFPLRGFPQIIYKDDYIQNGIRVLKKYLLPSLEFQSCKNFIWILKLGDKANITFVKSLLDLNYSFESNVIYEKNIKDYIKNVTKGYDILITTRIDYDDRIYYDAVNDVRKSININKPILLYGYNCGIQYYELDGKYFILNIDNNKIDVSSVFVSLIVVLNKVNDTYNIYDIGTHAQARKTILQKHKSFGIKDINYEPAIFDSGFPKFVWVRQNYSGQFYISEKKEKNLKPYKFDLNKFYGK